MPGSGSGSGSGSGVAINAAWVRELIKRQSCTIDKNGRQHTRIFQVQLLDLDDSPAYQAAIAYDGTTEIPNYADTHPTDTRAQCVSIKPSGPTENRLIWEVVCEYKTASGGLLPIPAANPIDEPAVISWGSITVLKPMWETPGGTKITDTAGKNFDPTHQEEHYKTVLTITRNEASYNPETAEGYRGRVNAGAVTVAGKSIGARCGLLTRYDATSAQTRNDVTYYQVTYEIIIDSDTWDIHPLNEGLFYKDGSGNVIRATMVDKDGKEVKSDTPVYLDNNGAITTTPMLLTFNTKNTADFSNLNLPTTMN